MRLNDYLWSLNSNFRSCAPDDVTSIVALKRSIDMWLVGRKFHSTHLSWKRATSEWPVAWHVRVVRAPHSFNMVIPVRDTNNGVELSKTWFMNQQYCNSYYQLLDSIMNQFGVTIHYL